MAARSRDSVAPSPSSESQMTYSRFLELFPDNDACLEYLKEKFYSDGTECPKCGKASKFHRIKGRSAYSCQWCGNHVYPTAGTIFHKSTVSLQLWFFGVYLMTSTRCGISAKQLEREIGVTYKTAHRMFKQIRTLLTDEGESQLAGDVEIDESAYGGKLRESDRRKGRAHIRAKMNARPTVWAAVERGGRVRAKVIKDRTAAAIEPPIYEYVLPASMVYTDDFPVYTHLGRLLYRGHKRINHSAKVYVEGDVHTQTVEGFFGLFKNGVRGVYHSVSTRYLQNYLDEYTFRYNRRFDAKPMFWSVLDRVQKPALAFQPTDS